LIIKQGLFFTIHILKLNIENKTVCSTKIVRYITQHL